MDAILITGPTASGKSALAAKLAEKHNGEVINADSMQVYDTLRVLTARPSEKDTAAIPHHLYGTVAASSLYSTGAWLRDIGQVLEELRAREKLPVIVGGTGLYFKALTGGLSDMPEIPVNVRDALRGRLVNDGPLSLHRELLARDPETAVKLEQTDGQRIVRALEILETTGKSIRDFQGHPGAQIVNPQKAMKYIVLPERDILHQRINRRFETMLEEGAVEETEALLSLSLPPEMPVMKAIGVSQIARMLAGDISRREAIEFASAATRQYAKRQMTWFRNQMDGSWTILPGADVIPDPAA